MMRDSLSDNITCECEYVSARFDFLAEGERTKGMILSDLKKQKHEHFSV